MSVSDETHLLSLRNTRKSIENFDNSDYDDDVEVVFNLDTEEK